MPDYALGASPPLERRSLVAAGLLGLCLGPFGTALTLGTWPDFLLTGSVYVVSSVAWGGRGMLFGLVFTGLYGLVRAASINARRDAAERVVTPPSPILLEATSVVVELEAAGVFPPAAALPVAVEEPTPAPASMPEPPVSVEDAHPVLAVEPAAPEALPEAAPVPLELPEAAPMAEVEPPSPPTPPAPRKRGRPKGSRKLAA